MDKLLEELQTISKVTGSIEKTIQKKNARNNLFKQIYYCHFNTRRRKTTKDLKKKSSRNINCPAKLILTLKKIIPMSKSKANNSLNKIDKEYPCLLEFRNYHNHRSDVREALRTRPLGEDTKNAILELFQRGHSVASAYHTYCTTKMEELGD
ncbi:unnamed protein product [Psylliodes chrysocephalus]|uniref:Uncharacterized protein n=1 Tax=Psylliodes chrysocephalus TaxID=3402493 RepID=A0A9P0GHD4_9CUCU|nr:unnamed protein product [Psylliodes chrysocephala]